MTRVQARTTAAFRAYRRWLLRTTFARLTEHYERKFEEALSKAKSGDFYTVTFKEGDLAVTVVPRADVYLDCGDRA